MFLCSIIANLPDWVHCIESKPRWWQSCPICWSYLCWPAVLHFISIRPLLPAVSVAVGSVWLHCNNTQMARVHWFSPERRPICHEWHQIWLKSETKLATEWYLITMSWMTKALSQQHFILPRSSVGFRNPFMQLSRFYFICHKLSRSLPLSWVGWTQCLSMSAVLSPHQYFPWLGALQQWEANADADSSELGTIFSAISWFVVYLVLYSFYPELLVDVFDKSLYDRICTNQSIPCYSWLLLSQRTYCKS